ncbi:MAG: methylated-DNA--[protein]-cysteine S-methyltransferase [Gemmatimonadota bacterium]
MTHDPIDARLNLLFRPEDPPPGLAARVARSAPARAARAGRLSRRLLDRLSIQASAHGITRLHLGRLPPSAGAAARRLVDRAHAELREYFRGRRAYFSVPADLSALGAFQKSVLMAALRIPFGETRAYAWIARRVGSPRAVRAVGTALGRNPVPLIVPCHRVLRSDGVPGGYGLGIDLKPLLLDLERSTPLFQGNSATRVICRVGCPASQRTRADRRVVFASVDDARSVGYRPCRVCRPQQSA